MQKMRKNLARNVPVLYKIEKGVDLAEFSGAWIKFAKLMQIDDSVVVATAAEAENLRQKLLSLGFVGARRRLEDGKYRVWRVA